MGLSFKKLKEGLIAQINPFDGNRTFDTVTKSQPVGYRQAPASQDVMQKIQNARYGVLANNPQKQTQFLNSVRPTSVTPFADAVRSGVKTYADAYTAPTRVFNPRTNINEYNNTDDLKIKQLQQAARSGQISPQVASANINALMTTRNAGINQIENTDAYNPTNTNKLGGALINTSANRKLAPVTSGMYRSAIGTGEAISGLYDTITPGKGNNRFGQNIRRQGEIVDQSVKQNDYNQLAYKAGQIGTDVATFMLPGAAVARGAATAGKLVTKAPVIGKVASKVDKAADAGNLVAKGTRYLTKPANLVNTLTDTALNTGYRANRGQDINAGTLGMDAGLSIGMSSGIGLVGAGAKAGINKIVKPAVKSAQQGSPGAALDIEKNILQDYKAAELRAKDPKTKAILAERVIAQQDKINTMKSQMKQGGYVRNPLVNEDGTPRIGKAPKTEGVAPTYLDSNTSQRTLNKIVEPNAEVWSKWFKGSDHKALPAIEKDILNNPALKDAGTSRLYDYYKKMFGEDISFDDFMNKDITLYRGGNTTRPNSMASYTLLERKAKRFGDVSSITVKPKDTYGMLGDFSEGEVFVPKSTPPKGVAPKSAPIEKTPTLQDALEGKSTKPTVKVAEPSPKPVAKPMVEAATPPKPKVTVKKTVETPPPTEKPNVVKSNETKPTVTKKKGFNEYVDDIAQSQGIDTNYKAPEMFAWNRALNAVSGGKKQNLMQLSPFRWAAQKTEDAIAKQAQKANVSRRGSKTLNTSRTVFAQTGINDADRMANRRFRDSQTLASDLTKGEMRVADDMTKNLPDPEKSLDNVYRYVADDKILERTHGKGSRPKLSDLSPEERAIADRIVAIQKRTNEINYKIGKITEEQFLKESKKGHYARIFNIESKGGKQLGKKPIDTAPFQGRKDPSEFSDSLMELLVKDPFRGALARQEIALRSLASHEFMGELTKQGRLLKNKPNNSFQQLNGKKYGKYDGMWADNTTRSQIKQNMEFESDWAKKYVGQLLDDYKASIMGKTQRVLKATKTVLNPGTNVQNVMSNILFFNRGSGVGIIRNATGMARAAKDLASARNGNLTAELIQAKKLGVFGDDSGKAMVGDIGAQDLASIPGKKNVVMKGLGVAEDIYGGTDNAAKLGLWRNLQKKGLSPEAAAQQVQKFTQDYHNVGRVIGAMADAPVLGKPFARFIPELVRLSKNNIVYNPAATVASLAALAYAGNALSEKAGETDEERANREAMIGNTNLPGTSHINKMLGGPDRDISLNFAVGDNSVNIARTIGLNFPTEPGQDPNRALLEQLLPFEVPTRKDAQGNEVFDPTKIITQLGIRPIVEVATDRNFMGQSIKDPENKVRVEGSDLGKTYQGDLPASEQRKNVAGHLFRAYAPMGNEIDSLVAAFKGEPNAMGKERTPAQAAMRTVGIKVEKNDQAARDKRASTKEFFEGKVGQVNDFFNKNPDLKETYLKIKSGTKDRDTGKKVVDLVTPEKWQMIAGEKSGRLFEQLKTEDEYQNSQDSSYPVDPIFSDQLSKEQRNQILQIRASYSGDNIEQEEILRATKPWYQNFEAAERDRSTKLSTYFDKLKAEGKLSGDTQNERVKAYGELYDKYSPKQTPLMTKYYQLKESNPDAAKNLFKTNPELSDQFSSYKDQKLKYINEKRKIEGVPPIDRNTFLNVTFGYEDDERKVYNELKYGRGYGGYSSRGGGSGGSNAGYDNPYKYAVSGAYAKPTKSNVKLTGASVKRGVAMKAATKPKVSIKKSLT